MALAGRGLALADRGMALAGRTLALLDLSERGGEGVMVCFAEKGLWEDTLTERGWLLFEEESTFDSVMQSRSAKCKIKLYCRYFALQGGSHF